MMIYSILYNAGSDSALLVEAGCNVSTCGLEGYELLPVDTELDLQDPLLSRKLTAIVNEFKK